MVKKIDLVEIEEDERDALFKETKLQKLGSYLEWSIIILLLPLFLVIAVVWMIIISLKKDDETIP